MQHTHGNRRFYSHTLIASVLCLLPLTVFALTDPNNPTPPIVDISPPTNITGFATPVAFNAVQPIRIVDVSTEIGAASPAVIVVTDEINAAFPTFNFSPSGSLGPLQPGTYTITWTATDLGFNSLALTQTVNIRPSVSLEVDQTVGEGGTAIVTAHLSGKAPSYPVTIPYTVGGTAGGGDHGAGAGGNFVFAADETEASISFSITDDGPGDAGETVIITLGALPGEVFAGPKLTNTVTIGETNVAPLARPHATQAGKVTRVITSGDGTVTICAMPDCGNAYDANGDTITYDWSASDNALAPTSGTVSNTFTFDPQGLSAGFYTVRLTVSDASSTSSYDLLLRLFRTAPSLSSTADSDNDSTTDSVEGIQDNDNDGIPNYLDAIEANITWIQGYEPYVFKPNLINGATLFVDSIKLNWAVDSTASNLILYPLMITTEPGHEIHLGPTAFTAARSYARISTASAETLRGVTLPTGIVSSDGQVIDIEITNLNAAGDSALIVVPQIAPIPASLAGALPLFKLFSSVKTWETFSADANNEIKTATSKDGDGYCPALNPANYPNTLAAGEECLLIKIEDGGPNDYDGAVNGAIRLMGGVFITSASTPLIQSSGSGVFSGGASASTETLGKSNLGTGGGGGSLGLLSLLGLLLTSLLYRQGSR